MILAGPVYARVLKVSISQFRKVSTARKPSAKRDAELWRQRLDLSGAGSTDGMRAIAEMILPKGHAFLPVADSSVTR